MPERRLPRRLRAGMIAATILLPLLATNSALALPRLPRGESSLLVTFWDRPSAAEARARLGGLGTVTELVAEAGTWAVAASGPSVRDRALARARVRAADWSLERRSDEITDPPAPVPAPGPLVAPGADPTDPYFLPSKQWGLFDPATTWSTDLLGADPRPKIAILDGGIDATHEEWSTPELLVYPRSTYRNSANANDWGRSGHGTHVAGIAAAPANGVGIVGVAPANGGTAQVIPVQIADQDGRSTDKTMIQGIKWAVNHGAKVINISAGGPGYNQAFQNTVNWAFQHALIVSSVGNDGGKGDDLNYPAAYDHVLGVGAQCDAEILLPECPKPYGPARFSNHNISLDVIAPGVDVLSSVPKRVHDREDSPGYALKDGTSMASPFVAGVALLVFANNRDPATGQYPSPDQVLRQIEATAIDTATPGRDLLSGHGIVNPEAAVTTTLPPRDTTEPNDDIRDLAGVASLKDTQLPATIPQSHIDRYDDPNDVYTLQLRKGQRVRVRVDATGVAVALKVWRPSAGSVRRGRRGFDQDALVAESAGSRAGRTVIAVRAPVAGRYYLQVAARSGSGDYALTVREGPAV